MYVLVSNNKVITYPYSAGMLKQNNKNISFPSTIPDDLLATFNVFPVTQVNKPIVDYTQVVEETTPVLTNGQWTQTWNVRAATPAEQSAATATLIQECINAVQVHLDVVASTRNYSGIISACSYASGTHPKYSAEGKACLAWREAVWDKCYQILNEVELGTRPVPTADEVIAELPQIVWPT